MGIHIFPFSAIVVSVLEKGWASTPQETIQWNQYLMLTILKFSIRELLGDLQNTSPGETSQVLVTCFLHCTTNWVLSANSIRTFNCCNLQAQQNSQSEKPHTWFRPYRIQKQWLTEAPWYTKHFRQQDTAIVQCFKHEGLHLAQTLHGLLLWFGLV